MTDRCAEYPGAEDDLVCGSEPDPERDDPARGELDYFLDHLDDIDRDQRHFERYGSDDDHSLVSGLEAPLVFEPGHIRSLLANWAFVQSANSLDDPHRLMLDYKRPMKGFLLLNLSPESIAINWLGGRSLAQ